IGKDMADLLLPPSVRAAHRRGLASYLRSGDSAVIGKRVEMMALRADGSEFPVELTITRIAAAGAPMVTRYLRDLTERQRAEQQRPELLGREQVARAAAEAAERRAAFLAEASVLLSSTLDYHATLSALARLAVPAIADWCVVDVVTDAGSIA